MALLRLDEGSDARLFLVFLSDGAPSDHCELACQHGIQARTIRLRVCFGGKKNWRG